MAEWAFNIARDEYPCPRCGAKKGEYCRTPKGKKTQTPHGERVRQLTAKDMERCKGRAYSAQKAVVNLAKGVDAGNGNLVADSLPVDHPPAKIPRYHNLIAAGVPEKQALAWHEAILSLEGHALSMAEGIEQGADNLKKRAVWFRSAHGPIKG